MFFASTRNENVKAIYTGRFSYVLGNDREMTLTDFEKIVRKGADGSVDLLEEYNHFKLFLWSISGLYINGLRWIVRLLYNITGCQWFPFDYYKARSIFFGLSYEFHETNVGNKDFDLKKLIFIDLKVIRLSAINSRLYLLFLLFFPMIWFIGLVISYHFTTRVCDHNSDDPKETNISKFGYVGIEKNKEESLLLRKVGSLLEIESYFNYGSHIDWMLSKYLAEKLMWTKYQRDFKFGHQNSFDEYIEKYVHFVNIWFGGVILPKHMIKLMRNPERGNNIPLKYKKGVECFAWFAYAHGN